ncbi:hypothetical protein EZH22_09240 [Xanthobacter dioxanivorans]|uniref:Uncharacterized protein n=1 Tax=Xanthobacter dioxanivorans TaxID=2528964 RepID=A0A974PSA7_9HYPH|nr:hypothetical protein [Xanthobacter dioxanivorans]QRG08449.1 hypothetical protein EZH22_09240 [Xanthobacter dioxanivorans]
MRYALLAAISAALLSTTAFAQESAPQPQRQHQRSYAPVAAPSSPANRAFPQGTIDREQGTPSSSLTEEDRLFLMQGDRGLGNG